MLCKAAPIFKNEIYTRKWLIIEFFMIINLHYDVMIASDIESGLCVWVN